jgi:mono/diheme cytochrome c family protein
MRVLKWFGIIVGGILGIVAIAVGVVYALTEGRIGKTWEVAGHEVAVPSDSAALALGEHVATVRGCTGCHMADLGGGDFIKVPVVAVLYAANLTAGTGGVGDKYTSAALWERAIRQGVGFDGRSLLFMPSHEYYPLSDEDLGALIAYLRSRPAVDRTLGEQSVGPVGRALFLSGKLPLVPAELVDHDAARPTAPAAAVNVEYGRYLAVTCIGCHGNNYSGGPIPGAPPEMAAPRNITPDDATGIGSWNLADFTRALREGIRPDGTKLAADMPIPMTSKFTDQELEAIWMYLRTLPPRTYGGR